MTGSHIPVDITDIISPLIFSDFREYHSTSLEGTVILSCENILAESRVLISIFRIFFKSSLASIQNGFVKNVSKAYQGTATLSSISVITSSVPILFASAS